MGVYVRVCINIHEDAAYMFPSDHDVVFACLGTSRVVCADVMLNAPFARILTVCTLCTSA